MQLIKQNEGWYIAFVKSNINFRGKVIVVWNAPKLVTIPCKILTSLANNSFVYLGSYILFKNLEFWAEYVSSMLDIN